MARIKVVKDKAYGRVEDGLTKDWAVFSSSSSEVERFPSSDQRSSSEVWKTLPLYKIPLRKDTKLAGGTFYTSTVPVSKFSFTVRYSLAVSFSSSMFKTLWLQTHGPHVDVLDSVTDS